MARFSFVAAGAASVLDHRRGDPPPTSDRYPLRDPSTTMQSHTVAKSVPGSAAGIEVRTRAPFAVGIVLWRDEAARVVATVVAKATFRLEPGKSPIAETPDPIRHPDEYWDDGAAGSLRFPSDLAPFKAGHELLVVGHAHATSNRPVHQATARVVTIDIDKMIATAPPRRFDRDGHLESGPPQTRFSLRYELAPGGADSDNPVGIDPTSPMPGGGYRLPQIAPANFELRPGQHVPLVGFGPVSHAWPARQARLRPEDREWLLDPLRRPRPRAFDARYFFTAPVDQRSAEAFRADERLVLEGLHPTHARLVTNLGGVSPMLRAIESNAPTPTFVGDTIYIDTDRQIATLAFRATVPLGDKKLMFDLVASDERDAAPGDVGRIDDATMELDRSVFADAAASALPFPPPSEPSRAPVPSSVDGLPFRAPSPSVPPDAPTSPSSPPPPRSTIGQLQSLLRPLDASDEAPREELPRPPPDAPRSGDPFRKAFGTASVSERGAAKPASVVPPPASGTKATADVSAPIVGARAASDAAAASERAAADVRAALEARVAATRGASSAERAPVTRRAIVDLLAYEPAVPSRLRRSKTYAPLLVEAPSARGARKVDAPAGDHDKEERARLDVLRVLSCGTPLGVGDLHAAFEALLHDESDFDIPLLLVEGDVRPTMDEVETLRVAVNLAKPLAGTNKRVQTAIAVVNEALAGSAPPVSEAAIALSTSSSSRRRMSCRSRLGISPTWSTVRFSRGGASSNERSSERRAFAPNSPSRRRACRSTCPTRWRRSFRFFRSSRSVRSSSFDRAKTLPRRTPMRSSRSRSGACSARDGRTIVVDESATGRPNGRS